LKEGESVPCEKVEALPHETKPPARYTEASLTAKLEEEGIGRPSTYASILGKLSDGRFARRDGKTLIPTYIAFAVVEFLEKYFPNLIDLKFTARMEDDLDKIAEGKENKVTYLHDFYRREGAFKDQVENGDSTIKPDDVRQVHLEEFEGILRVGRYGAYVQIGEGDNAISVNIPDSIPPADLSIARVTELAEEKARGPVSLGKHPETGEDIYIMKGRFGPYVQQGEVSDDNPKPRRSSIPKNVAPEDLTLDKAVEMLALPRRIGTHPDDGEWVESGVGRFGPFVKHNKEYRSLGSPEEVFTVTLEQALALLKEPKGKRKGQAVLKELGAHPKTGENIQVLDGRYGPYIKAGKTNASLPKGLSPDELTMDKAVEIIAEKRAS